VTGRATPEAGPVVAATVAGREFLPRARVLADSLARWHPELPIVLLYTGRAPHLEGVTSHPFTEVVPIEALGLPDLAQRVFRCSSMELAVSAKELILSLLLDRGFERALFLDADLLLLARLDDLLAQLENCDLLLTPHHLAPLAGPDRIAREVAVLRAGTINGGVYGVRRGEPARAFLGWWRERMRLRGERRPEAGLHHDQRWLDLGRCFVERVGIVRDPGINVAYWNLPERPIGASDGRFTAAGCPLRLFHFSGFDPRAPEQLSRHAPSIPTSALGPGAAFARDYAEAILAAERAAPWSDDWDRFDDGTPIPDIARALYRGLGDEVGRFGDPFRTAGASAFLAWLMAPEEDDHDPVAFIPRLWRGVVRARPDLVGAFPDPLGRDRGRLLAWTRTSGTRELEIPETLLPPAVR